MLDSQLSQLQYLSTRSWQSRRRQRGELGPECGKYMESDEEMEHEDAKTKERWDLEKEDVGNPLPAAIPIRYSSTLFSISQVHNGESYATKFYSCFRIFI